ncbi:hypothetical protein [Variovorax sp.]|jgi:hypothetical protein|uniref:hypothetical protein n=1 Tax=Variovorax sp. TaxID=1871043 RepID=UPI0037D9B855
MDDQQTAPSAPETTLDAMKRVLATLNSSKAWALAKAQGVEDRITAVGGAAPAELQAVINDIRAAAAA